jgi:hypothetical protein
VHAAEGITVWRRLTANAAVEEYRAIGVLDLPAGALAAVLHDHDRYIEFFPFLVEDRQVPNPGGIYRYQRVRAPFVAERDYTLRLIEQELPGGGLRMYFHEANAIGPPPSPTCVRVPLVRGMWEVVALGESSSRVTYHLLSDPGGALPDFFLRFVTRKGVWNTVAALRDRTRLILATQHR